MCSPETGFKKWTLTQSENGSKNTPLPVFSLKIDTPTGSPCYSILGYVLTICSIMQNGFQKRTFLILFSLQKPNATRFSRCLIPLYVFLDHENHMLTLKLYKCPHTFRGYFAPPPHPFPAHATHLENFIDLGK